MSLAYSDIASQWQPQKRSGLGFFLFTTSVLIAFLVMGLILSSIDLPTKERAIHAEVPERIAQYVKKMAKPLPVPTPVIKKPEIKKPAIPKIKKQRKAIEKPLSAAEKSARERVVDTGLLALSSELSALSDASDFSDLEEAVSTQSLRDIPIKKDNNAKALLEGIGKPVVVVNEENSSKVEVQTRIQRRELASLEDSTIQLKSKDLSSNTNAGDNKSSVATLSLEEELGLVFEKNKSRLYSVYERARRKNPNLEGKILLELSIDVTGKVVEVIIVSSSLNDAALERRIIARVKQFVFASQGRSGVTKLRYPIEFLPG
jgi:TonB family protein